MPQQRSNHPLVLLAFTNRLWYCQNNSNNVESKSGNNSDESIGANAINCHRKSIISFICTEQCSEYHCLFGYPDFDYVLKHFDPLRTLCRNDSSIVKQYWNNTGPSIIWFDIDIIITLMADKSTDNRWFNIINFNRYLQLPIIAQIIVNEVNPGWRD